MEAKGVTEPGVAPLAEALGRGTDAVASVFVTRCAGLLDCAAGLAGARERAPRGLRCRFFWPALGNRGGVRSGEAASTVGSEFPVLGRIELLSQAPQPR